VSDVPAEEPEEEVADDAEDHQSPVDKHAQEVHRRNTDITETPVPTRQYDEY